MKRLHASAVARDSKGAWSYATVWRVADRNNIPLTAGRETMGRVVWWTPKLGQKLGRLKRESHRLSFPGYAARSLLLDAITFLS